MKLDEVVSRLGDFTEDAILITAAEPLTAPGPPIVWCNPAFERMTGYSLDEIIGQTPRIFQGPDTDPATRARIGRKLAAWGSVREELLNYHRDGTAFWLDMSIVPVADASGWFHYWVSVQRDVTERRRRGAELDAYRASLEEKVERRTATIRAQAADLERALARQTELNEQQIQFVRVASHEFRTPLSVIAMAVRQVRRRLGDSASADIGERLGMIDSAVLRLTKQISSMLYLARADHGQLHFDIERIDLGVWVEQYISDQDQLTPDGRLRITCNCAAPVMVDAGLFEQVFENIVGNARKYSPSTAPIDVSLTSADGAVRLSVRDRGVGIGAQDLPRIGQRYFRAASSTGIAGTGIGLTVVRDYLDVMGGHLEIASELGCGSTFTIVLPAAPAAAAAEDALT